MAIKTKTVDFGRLTLKVNDILYGVADGNDAGTLLSSIDMSATTGVTAGIAEADKAIILDASANLDSGINDFTIDGDLTVSTTATVTGALTVSGGLKMAPVVHPANDTTIALSVADSGKVHIIPDLDATSTFTLPIVAAGLSYEFWYGGVAADAANFVLVPQAGTFFTGGVVFADAQADATTAVFGDGAADDTFTIVTPSGGTNFKVVSDGTTWFITGTVVSTTVCTIA
jgi:hypothetical protein